MAAKISTRKVLAAKMAQGLGFRSQAVGDDRTCPECMAKNGKYQNGTGPKPPYHPNCRCSAGK